MISCTGKIATPIRDFFVKIGAICANIRRKYDIIGKI
jgi:hypothetical protein